MIRRGLVIVAISSLLDAGLLGTNAAASSVGPSDVFDVQS